MKYSLLFFIVPALALGQAGPKAAAPPVQKPRPVAQQQNLSQLKDKSIADAERNGVQVRIKGIAHFRGVRSNQLMGTGLVVGLAGTGDTKKSVFAQQIISNLFKNFGVKADPTQFDVKNVAAVIVTAELPPFASNGQAIDVEVQSIGDAKSLVGGTLLQTPLYAAGDQNTIYVVGQGSVNVGGFDVSSGGASNRKNHVTAGHVPEGGIVERGAATTTVVDGKMYLDLNQADMTTAQRISDLINKEMPEMNACAVDGGSIMLSLPSNLTPVAAMSRIEEMQVYADTLETIVINEKTGTIVIGGNVKIGPAAIVHGSLNVRIDQDVYISQPNPLSLGQTAASQKTNIDVRETKADVASLAPNTTVADLAKVLHALQLKASDVIAILQALREQGALKARIVSK
jgi:flagellar P-ring protein precursor FlgI